MRCKNKKLLLTIFLSITLVINCYATAAGVQTGAKINENGVLFDLKGNIRSMRLPVVFGFGANCGIINNKITYGFSGFGDYWFLDKQLYNTISLYAGPGLAIQFQSNTDNQWIFNPGIRGIVGINMLLLDSYIELYIQGGVEPGLNIPLSDPSKLIYTANFPVETGIRFHF